MAERITRAQIYTGQSTAPAVAARQTSFPRLLVVRAVCNDYGEVSERFQRMVNNLHRSGWDARICLSGPQSHGGAETTESPAKRVRHIRSLYRSISKSDIIQIVWDSHNSFITDVFPALALGRFLSKRVVLRCTGDSIEQTLERWGRFIVPALRTIDSIVVSSGYMVDTLARYGLDATAIPPIIDTSSFPPRVVRDVQPKLLCMRPLETDMNVACAVRAYALAKRKYPRSELIIAGDGPLRQELEQTIADQGLAGVTFMGAVDDIGRRDLLQAADIFVNSSSRDDLPPVLLEAMAAGLPVVTTDAGGIPELIQDHKSGLTAAINDHVGLADAIIDLVESPQLTESLSTAGRAEAELFTWPRLRHRWLELYVRQTLVA